MGTKVVIADDDKGYRRTLVSLTSKCGLIPIAVRSGEIALSVLEDNPDVALLITDILMPGLDGKSLTSAVRNHPTLSHLPVIVVAGTKSPKIVSDVLTKGASCFLPKPVELVELQRYLGECLPHITFASDNIASELAEEAE